MVEAKNSRGGRRPSRPSTPFHLEPLTLPLLGLLSLLATLLTGCASATSVRRAPTATSAPTYAPYPTPTPPPPTLSLRQAWGNVHITRLPISLPNNEMFNFVYDMTPDGQWLVGDVQARDLLDNTTVIPYLALYNVSTRQIR